MTPEDLEGSPVFYIIIPLGLVGIVFTLMLLLVSQLLSKAESAAKKSSKSQQRNQSQRQKSHSPPAFKTIRTTYITFDDLKDALRCAGLDTFSAVIGVDFTGSNRDAGRRTFGRQSLHTLSTLNGTVPTAPPIGNDPTETSQYYYPSVQLTSFNPYQRVIEIIGLATENFVHDGKVSAYGFGDSSTTDRSVFPFVANPTRPCDDFRHALQRYNEFAPVVQLSGPTSYKPLIEEALRLVRTTKRYHILFIITDGQPSRPDVDAQAIVDASKYPLSIITIGVGDGPWQTMEEFDDELPARTFDNFQFIDYNEVMTELDNDPLQFARVAFEEIPEQYQAIQRLGLLDRL